MSVSVSVSLLTRHAVKEQRISLYYFIEKLAREKPNDEAIWSRVGCYTWKEVYDRANQYAKWYLANGIKPGDLVAFFMVNTPDFVIAWIGLWAIGEYAVDLQRNVFHIYYANDLSLCEICGHDPSAFRHKEAWVSQKTFVWDLDCRPNIHIQIFVK